MGKRYLYWLLILFWGFGFLGMQTVAGMALDTGVNIHPDNFQARFEWAQDPYQTAGLADYFPQRSLLWTETSIRRNDLASKLPVILPAKIEQSQALLLHLLEINPNDLSSLILAGDYHYFYRQKQTALWYYQQAYKLAPQSEMVNMALADFYLYEWQPERVRDLLAGFKSPAASLRKGAACLQAGEYPLALGYLIQADPLPSTWQITRDKDLYKTYLALGEVDQANSLIKEVYLQQALCGTIFRELMGWSAWLTGDYKGSISNWRVGKLGNNAYKLWESYIEWLQPDQYISNANATKDFHDSYLNAVFEINQGQKLYKKGQWDLAYKEYLAAIDHDHRSLVGFLGASTVQLRKQDYSKALDLCNQGLAVNSDFSPLLAKRAEVFEKLGRLSEAANDRADLATVLSVSAEVTIIHPRLIQSDGRSVILVQGNMRDLVGFWVSSEGINWKWYPWWGGPVTLSSPLTTAWVVPTGPGLSGKAFYLENGEDKAAAIQMSPLQPQDEQVLIQLPFPAKLVVEFYDQQKLKAYVGDQLTMEHRIPVALFSDCSSVLLQILWQNEAGFWGTFKNNIDLPKPPTKPAVEYIISTEPLITNHRRIDIQLASIGGTVDDDVMVSLGEILQHSPGPNGWSDVMTEWLPFQPIINYTLSAGDGAKTVIVKFRDRTGNIQEDRLKIELDTQAPTLTMLGKNLINPQTVQLKWSASEVVTIMVRIFTDQGNWLEIPVLANPDGVYSGDVSLQSTVFCQIAAEDSAGNIKIIADEALNTQLREATTVAFDINGGIPRTSSRWILIKPKVADISWAVSNDLLIWSGWQQGETGLTWRVNPGDGEHLIFIKYKTAAAALIHYQVATVYGF